MLDNKMEPAVARNMVKGLPDTLHSEFRLSYSMLLNLQRGEGRMQAKELLASSFKQFQVEQALPALKEKVKKLEVSFVSTIPFIQPNHPKIPVCATNRTTMVQAYCFRLTVLRASPAIATCLLQCW